MKRIPSAVIAVLLVLFLFIGCGREINRYDQSSDDEKQKISVVTTIFPAYDFARQIAGEQVGISMLLPPGGESHSFEPTPSDIIKIQNCKVFVYVGGQNDQWVDKILDSVDTSNMKIISLLDSVSVLEEEIKEGMDAEHEHDSDAAGDHDHEGDVEDEHEAEGEHENEGEAETEHDSGNVPEYDEHVWTSPKNAVLIVKNIMEVLCEVDPENEDIYRANGNAYIHQLNQLDREFEKLVSSASRKTILFGDRFPFRYFAEEYGLDYWAAFPGCSTETEPSAATVAFLTDKIKEEKIPVVFKIELSSGNIARSISEATGAKVLTLHSCHNLSKADFQNGETYLSLMEKNLSALKEALY